MGCDYYIIKILRVIYIDTDSKQNEINIEIYRERGYFYHKLKNDTNDTCDSDDSDWLNNYLIVTFKPRILFQNNKWKNDNVQKKYEYLIKRSINSDFNLLNVTKIESRELR